jgi:small-conductance mechanosensitive channel
LTDSKIAQSTTVTVSYTAPVDEVMSWLLQACQAHPQVLADPAPLVALSALGVNGLEFTVNYWLDDSETGPLNLKSDIHLAILKTLQAHGVEIPFPQRVVHMAGAAKPVEAG